MKKESRFALAILAGLVFVALITSAWPASATTSARSHPMITNEQTPAPAQSVTGKITAVEKNTFTLAVASGTTSEKLQLNEASPKSMTFHIDKNTTIDGKLQVGSNADVTYREENGQNLAISVRVTQ